MSHKNKISNCLNYLNLVCSKYDNFVFIGDFSVAMSDKAMEGFCSLNNLESFIKDYSRKNLIITDTKKFWVTVKPLFSNKSKTANTITVQKMKFSIEDFFSVRHSSVTNPADLVTFTEKILHGKLHFLCSVLLSMRILEWLKTTRR